MIHISLRIVQMDPFSDIIALLRPHAVFSKPITGRGEWGVRYPAYGAPGFSIVLSGQCWLAVEKDEPVRLARGDFVLLPASPAFEMLSRPVRDASPASHRPPRSAMAIPRAIPISACSAAVFGSIRSTRRFWYPCCPR
jgi:hypothetical protein